MKFSEKLNEYIVRLSCTAKDICNLSGISAASFSRYRKGERVPELGTKHFEGLCSALSQIAVEKDVSGITTDAVKEAFVTAMILYPQTRSCCARISTHCSLLLMSIWHSYVNEILDKMWLKYPAFWQSVSDFHLCEKQRRRVWRWTASGVRYASVCRNGQSNTAG